MTRERRLAIKMWEGIRDSLADKPKAVSNFDFIAGYKRFFCRLYTLNWHSYCWCCQYIRMKSIYGCGKCPLKSCFTGSSYYEKVMDIHKRYTVQERIDACNEIIAALKGAGTKTNSDS